MIYNYNSIKTLLGDKFQCNEMYSKVLIAQSTQKQKHFNLIGFPVVFIIECDNTSVSWGLCTKAHKLKFLNFKFVVSSSGLEKVH